MLGSGNEPGPFTIFFNLEDVIITNVENIEDQLHSVSVKTNGD